MINTTELRNKRDALKAQLEAIESTLALSDRRADARLEFEEVLSDGTYTMGFVRDHILPFFESETWELEEFDHKTYRRDGGELAGFVVSNGSGIEFKVTIEMCSDLD